LFERNPRFFQLFIFFLDVLDTKDDCRKTCFVNAFLIGLGDGIVIWLEQQFVSVRIFGRCN
jgi:hypothetical protein